MRMTIKEIEYDKNVIYVTGTTSIGSMMGVWQYGEEPIRNKVYFFELSLPEIAQDKIAIIFEREGHPSVEIREGEVLFTGYCEAVDDICVLRLAGDWLEMVEIKGGTLGIKKGELISFGVDCEEIGIYPYIL